MRPQLTKFQKSLLIIASAAVAIGIFVAFLEVAPPQAGAVTTYPWDATNTLSQVRVKYNDSIANLNGGITANAFTTTTIYGLSCTSYTFNSTSTLGISTSTPCTVNFGPDRAYLTLSSSSINGTNGPWTISGNATLRVSSSTGAIQLDNVGVQSATGSTYLNVSSPTGTVTFTNLGVQTLTCGVGLTCSSATGTITMVNSVVTTTINSVTSQQFQFRAGTGLTVATTTNGTTTFTNAGVTSLIAGSGINVDASTGAVTVTNTHTGTTTKINGMLAQDFRFDGGAGILISTTSPATTTITNSRSTTTLNDATTGNFHLLVGAGLSIATTTNGSSTFTNTGVTSLLAGSSTIVSGSTGAVTVSARPTNIPWTLEIATGTLASTPSCVSSLCLDHLFTFDSTSTIWKIRGKNKSNGDTVTWNMYYGASTTAPTATTTLFQMFTADQVMTVTSTPTSYTPNASTTPRLGDMLFLWYKLASSTQSHWDTYFTYN